MKPKNESQLCRIVQAWVTAARLLRIEVIAPYRLAARAESADCVAFLPDFGGPGGIVIGVTKPPMFETDALLIKLAKTAGMSWSFVNIKTYSQYNEKRFKETLCDWGFFGPIDRRPEWFSSSNAQMEPNAQMGP